MNEQQTSSLLNRHADDIIAFRSDGAVHVRQFVAEAVALSQQLPKHQYGLRRRPVAETLRVLEQVLDTWADPGSHWRAELESKLPAASGFSPQTVSKGLEIGLADWRGSALRALYARELGSLKSDATSAATRVSGFPATSVLLAGSIPMPSLLASLMPLVLRSPVLVKSASRDPVTPRLVASSIAEVDAELGRCIAVVDFPGSDVDCVRAFAGAECVVATGSDETVAAVAAHVPPPRRFVAYGHRLSVAAVGDAAAGASRLIDLAEGLALDVSMWDQLGCLSPIAVYVASDDADAPDRVAEALAGELGEAEKRWPRGAVDTAVAAQIQRERSRAELRAAAGEHVAVYSGAGTTWTVVREDSAEVRPAPLHRFIRVCPVADLAALVEALTPLSRHLAAVSIDGFGGQTDDAERALANLGASRLCRAGRMQRPPLGWRHDNRGVLTPLARFTDTEI